MLNLQAIKSAIPLVFSFIIIGFIAKLGYDNIQLERDNKGLRSDVKQLNQKNNGLAESVQTLSDQVGEQNSLIKAETKRRAAAEMKQQRLQDEIKEILKNNPCSVVVLPDGIVERLREKSDSVRSGKSEASTNTGKPAK